MTNRVLPRSARGFSFFEVLLAIIILMTALVFLFSIFTSSNQGTLDSYRETLAYCLAYEGLEWVGGVGYPRLKEMMSKPGSLLKQKLGLNEFRRVDNLTNDANDKIKYPDDYRGFERMISLSHYVDKRAIVIRVTVRPTGSALIRRGSVVLEKIVGAEHD